MNMVRQQGGMVAWKCSSSPSVVEHVLDQCRNTSSEHDVRRTRCLRVICLWLASVWWYSKSRGSVGPVHVQTSGFVNNQTKLCYTFFLLFLMYFYTSLYIKIRVNWT